MHRLEAAGEAGLALDPEPKEEPSFRATAARSPWSQFECLGSGPHGGAEGVEHPRARGARRAELHRRGLVCHGAEAG